MMMSLNKSIFGISLLLSCILINSSNQGLVVGFSPAIHPQKNVVVAGCSFLKMAPSAASDGHDDDFYYYHREKTPLLHATSKAALLKSSGGRYNNNNNNESSEKLQYLDALMDDVREDIALRKTRLMLERNAWKEEQEEMMDEIDILCKTLDEKRKEHGMIKKRIAESLSRQEILQAELRELQEKKRLGP